MSMAKVIFTYEGIDETIDCSKEDKMKDICQKYSSKIEVNTTLPSLNRHNSTKLAYFLMKEFDKGDKSFYKPYIDLILSNDYLNFPAFWNKEDIIELNDHEVNDKISNYKDEINQTYEQIIKKTDVNIFEQVIFKKIYLFI